MQGLRALAAMTSSTLCSVIFSLDEFQQVLQPHKNLLLLYDMNM